VNPFRALILDREGEEVTSCIGEVSEAELIAAAPEGAEVTVRIVCSTLNYKDGLAMAGLGKVVRHYPHIPGVDLAGEVTQSDVSLWKPGDKVIAGGYGIGEEAWGGFSGFARLRADWLVALPPPLTPRQAMAIGTAGLTAMEAVIILEEHGLAPDDGEVLVTGAGGGVGSIAVAVLATLGYQVTASTGRADTHGYLKALGAAQIIDRAELSTPLQKTLLPERWAGGVDTVGGTTLATILAGLKHSASVAAIGLVGGRELVTTVIPFLLRGVNLLGIDIVQLAMERRQRAWTRLATDLPSEKLESMIQSARLEDIPELGRRILEGKVRGRVVVEMEG
jgi:acrylyl-CoA reductase (NADPH)